MYSGQEQRYKCRACLEYAEESFPIFEEILEAEVAIIAMLNECSIQIDEDDEFPATLCLSCFRNLRAGYNFIKTFQRSQEVLKHEKSEKLQDDVMCDLESVGDSSDEQNMLIEQSIRLTQQYRMHKLDEDEEDDDNNRAQQQQLQCPFCQKLFQKFRVFRMHLSQHEGEGGIACTICAMNFADSDMYLDHYQRKHRFQCNLCDKSFPRCDTYNRHMKLHNNTLPKFICPVENCEKVFAVRQSLRNHFMSIHSDKRNFLCNLCGASFKNYDNLRYHIKKHNGPSHLCPYCGRRFMQAVHLKYHMWRHTGVKPYKCVNCEKTFVTKRILLAHMKKMHKIISL